MRRLAITIALALVSLLGPVAASRAVIVGVGGAAYGVSMVPGTRGDLASAGLAPVASAGPCADPFLSDGLSLPPTGALCWGGGPVIHGNETFALTWSPTHSGYWQTTKNYVQQFLRDVADGSGTLSSPYAITGQYRDGSNLFARAWNHSLYGGGCSDLGSAGGSACQLRSSDGSGAGHDFPATTCPLSGSCVVTDTAIQGEVQAEVAATGLISHTQPGYSPLIVVLTPPGTSVCIDSAQQLCSANSSAPARFCSYHSHVVAGGADVAYVVQPWTINTMCDEPDITALPPDPTSAQLETDAGVRLVSPLSRSQLAAITDPYLNGWVASDGSEIDDNGGCGPLASQDKKVDSVTVGNSSQNPYLLQREFNNAGVIFSDPNGPACAPLVLLGPTFVAPSAVNSGDVVQFDGSTTVSSLIVPRAGYQWDFGDGTTAVGPSVEHSFGAGGNYTVKLSVIDRGGNSATFSQTIGVLGPTGVRTTPATQHPDPGLRVRITLRPQSLRTTLRNGVAVWLNANEAAAGIATLSIPRATARKIHLRTGRAASVVVGRGTIHGLRTGTVLLHFKLPSPTAKRLSHLRHVTVTIRLQLVAANRTHFTIDAAGRY